MHHLARAVALASLLFAGACQVVHSREPLGARAHSVEAEDWNGTWMFGGHGRATLRVLDEARGLLEVAFVWDVDDENEGGTVRCQLLEIGDLVLANVPDPEGRGLYFWARVWLMKEQLILWPADGDRVLEAIAHGTLPGVRRGYDDAILGPLDDAQLELLLSYDARLVHLERPLALIRIAK